MTTQADSNQWRTGARTLPPNSRQNNASAEWVAGRVKTLLSHYRSERDDPLEREAMRDWLKLLAGHSEQAISAACDGYLRDQPRRWPTPGDIAARARTHDERRRPGGRDAIAERWANLTADDRHLLTNTILPKARRWLDMPGLADQGRSILAAWGYDDTGAARHAAAQPMGSGE